ncbi:response regulator transcription factor [candidate division KSB1 bacterium]|nr:response regulator transcription factor [candidate division KSB1 bacterium]
MEKFKILLIEDDPNLGFILQEALELEGFQVTRGEDGEAGQTLFLQSRFDLCLIDVMLPKKDGFALAREIRKVNQEIPLIFLTARSLKEDRIEGFKIGGDDYISKPFSMEELILRIQAVLKRIHKNQPEISSESRWTLGNYGFDFTRQVLSHAGAEQKLTDKEAELLRLLCLHQNQMLEREVALKLIWGDDNFFNARSMDVYISKLRKYLKADTRIEITNIHGKGFKLKVNSE